MADIKIVVGSTYGNAQTMAEDAAAQLTAMGHSVVILMKAKLSDLLVNDYDHLLVCTASIGEGEIPQNLITLYNDLDAAGHSFDDKTYSVIALGDSSYEYFARAGELFDELLASTKAKASIDTLFLDACEMSEAEDLLFDWVQRLESCF